MLAQEFMRNALVAGTFVALAFYSVYPVGFWVTSLSFAAYVGVRVAEAAGRRSAVRPVVDAT